MSGRRHRKRRQESAAVRAAERAARTDSEQLAKLEAGGHGECEEAQRLRTAVFRRRKEEEKENA